MIRAIIIEDLDDIRAKNSKLIKQVCPEVTIIAEANNVETAIKVIETYLPDLIFLDIELPDGTGFDLLHKIKHLTVKVIFITAFQQYALDAFRFSAIDYIMKPIDAMLLKEAVSRAQISINKEDLELKINTLLTNIERPNYLKKIIIKTSDKIFSINTQDIIYCEADRNYTFFYLIDGQKIIASNTLKEYDKLLNLQGFFRSHQSFLINMIYFDHYVKTDGGYIVLKNKKKIPLAPKRRVEMMVFLEEQKF